MGASAPKPHSSYVSAKRKCFDYFVNSSILSEKVNKWFHAIALKVKGAQRA